MNVTFQCVSCGLQKIGEPAVELARKAIQQKKAFEEALEVDRARREQERREREHAAEEARQEEIRRAVEAARQEEIRRQEELIVLSGRCAWESCLKSARHNSKYCSRTCSNKNARHRHRQRKKGVGIPFP
jgi:predicted Holliday junction resolvase-like endonuclease